MPYGLGAGSVDAALNNHVALHYESRHMSWLHRMGAWRQRRAGHYGLGTGPQQLAERLRIISVLQVVLTAIIIFSLPLWKNRARRPARKSPASTAPCPS